jgi:HAD superfamily hydrolase (TIGR01484 family)
MNMTMHYFFDLDNTLTPSKAPILPEHAPILRRLTDIADAIVVSGHGEKDIRAHLTPTLEGRYHILGQNGNFAETKDGRVLWNRSLSDAQKGAILAFIAKARTHLRYAVKDENDIIDDRDSQIAFSLIGHHEDAEKKKNFDPKHEIRLGLLRDMADDVEALRAADVEVRSGGTTVLDFFALGKNKGYNVAQYIEAMGWDTSECLYFGDALFPGGNDETVVGVIPTRAVSGPDDTFSYIKEVIG